MVVRLSWLSGRALAAQARGVLGSTPGDFQLFHFPLFSPHNLYINLLHEDSMNHAWLKKHANTFKNQNQTPKIFFEEIPMTWYNHSSVSVSVSHIASYCIQSTMVSYCLMMLTVTFSCCICDLVLHTVKSYTNILCDISCLHAH